MTYSDLLLRLRRLGDYEPGYVEEQATMAASAIEALSAKVTQLQAQVEMQREALTNVRKIISEAAATGFNCHDGDWAERLYLSQQKTSAALSAPTDGWPKSIVAYVRLLNPFDPAMFSGKEAARAWNALPASLRTAASSATTAAERE